MSGPVRQDIAQFFTDALVGGRYPRELGYNKVWEILVVTIADD